MEKVYLLVESCNSSDEATLSASLVVRMLLKWAEFNNFTHTVIKEKSTGVGGYESMTVEITGENAYKYFEREHGIHRITRISPVDSQARRHTTFTTVNLWKEGGQKPDGTLNEPIRSYILHPYTRAVDERTSVDTEDVHSVLNGDLKLFYPID